MAGDDDLSIVSIEGPLDVLWTLPDIEGLDLIRATATPIDGGGGFVEGYATDAALVEAAQRGCTIQVITGKEELKRHLDEVIPLAEGSEGTGVIRITGTLEALRSLPAADGLTLQPYTTVKADADTWSVLAEATPDAADYVRSEGFTVTQEISLQEADRRRALFHGETAAG